MRFLAATGQLWKLVFSLGSFLLGGTVIALQGFVERFVGREVTLNLVLVSLVVGLVGFVGASLLLRCPRCGLKLFWHVASTGDHASWFTRLFTMTECPHCHFLPRAHT